VCGRIICQRVMASVGLQRLRKEYKLLQSKPVENIRGVSRVRFLSVFCFSHPLLLSAASPLENNVLEWHYVIEGAKGTPYEGGWYHGEKI
jgi:ubiquitin-conjugating enzyme E2 J2